MKCPHCSTVIHPAWDGANIGYEPKRAADWMYRWMICPACKQMIVALLRSPRGANYNDVERIVWPRDATRPLPEEVEERYAADFAEAVAVLSISPKASAALSRRMLQDILREKAGVKSSNLYQEIQEAMGSVPAWLAENLGTVRTVGNIAAHTTKSEHTGEVVEVEPGEAEFLLDVLEGAFDFWFVQPARAQAQREAIAAKLKGEPEPEPSE